MFLKKNFLVIVLLVLNMLIIGVLFGMKLRADRRLQKLSGLMQRFGRAEIDYTVHVEDTLYIETAFNISHLVEVMVQMNVKYDLNLVDTIPVNQEIQTPINLQINKIIHVDTAFMFKDKIVVPLDEVIPVQQKITIPLSKKSGKGIRVPIVVDIPLKQNITLDIRNPIPIQTDIPISLPVSEEIPVVIDMQIPVNLEIPLNIPVYSKAVITFPYQLPVSGKIPLKLDIPVKIPLSATPLMHIADSIAVELENLLK